MALGDLNPASWRIDVYELNRSGNTQSGYVTDLSNFYTSDLSITKQRNYPDEVKFTLDLQQLEERATLLGITSREILEPYKHKVKIYRNNEFVMQAIVCKTDVNLNNESKNTIEVSCVDILGLFEKRLIHQDYGGGSWADFAKQVVMDAQHEPNRIYNYAFEGDGTDVSNAWFKGWKFVPGDAALSIYTEWEPNHLYPMYEPCSYDAKFWECKEHAFVSGEEFSESNWTLIGIKDAETGDISGVYGAWREDEEEAGPTGTALGGWGGTSSCHLTAQTYQVNNSGFVSSINLSNSQISTSLVSPYMQQTVQVPDEYQQLEYIQGTGTQYINTGLSGIASSSTISTKVKFSIDDISSECILLGATNASSQMLWPVNYNSSNIRHFFFGNDTDHILYNTAPTVGTVYEYSSTATSGAQSCTVNGNTVGKTATSDLTLSYPLYIFANNNQGTASDFAKAKLYYCTIFYNDVAIGHYIPAKRKSDNAIGLYDTVSGTFKTNQGSGSFVAGPEVGTDEFYHHLHAKLEIYPIHSTTIRLFLEGYGGEHRTYTGSITKSTTGSWQTITYDWPAMPFDVYRFGIQIVSGEALIDSPAVYQAFREGDEWDLGVRVGDFPSVTEQTDAGWIRNRSTSTYEWKDAKSTLLDLSNMDADNFWYEVDENYKFNVWVDRGKSTVEVNLSYPKNITSMTVSTNANNVFNYVKGDGSAEVTQDPLVSGVKNSNAAPFTWIGDDKESMRQYWALTDAISYNSERTIESLQSDIDAEIKKAAVMQDVPTIKIANNAVTPDQIGLGDMVSVEAIDIPYVQKVNGLYKIISYDIDVDVDGNESISLTLVNPTENQINALAFPQLIKMMLKRLKYNH